MLNLLLPAFGCMDPLLMGNLSSAAAVIVFAARMSVWRVATSSARSLSLGPTDLLEKDCFTFYGASKGLIMVTVHSRM
jgi:hypothetical protein